MGHELEILEDGRASMFYAGEVPWHGLGTRVEEAQTSEEAIKLAGLDWDVELGQLWGGPSQRLIDGRFAVYRVTDGKVLGVTNGRSYRPVQNREVFAFADSLVQDRVLRYETAGSLHGGAQVWVLARLDGNIEVAGDRHVPYLLLRNGHDASTPVSALPTSVRVVCRNTLDMAFNQDGKRGVRIRHTVNVKERMEEARRVLAVTTEQQRRYTEWLQSAAATRVAASEFDTLQAALFGPLDDTTGKQRREAIELFRRMYDAETAAVGQNAYAMANAVTGYGNHGIEFRPNAEGSERMVGVTFGSGAAFMQRGMATVAEVVNLPLPKAAVN